MAEFSRTWWGERFLAALEGFTDPARLARGRSYARNGKILSYKVTENTVNAKVRGSINPYFGVYKEPTYTTTITMTAIPLADWRRIIADLSGKASFVARLLMNEMPDNIEEAFAGLGLHLLPHAKRDFVTKCSCPDLENPCKHIAGVYYLLASDLDRDPFLLFELRGLSRENLRTQLAGSPLGKILAAELTPREVPIAPAASYHTRPEPVAAGLPAGGAALSHREFWLGAKRLPGLEPATPPSVPALLVKKQGDYPAFWPKDASFIGTMEELYGRVRSKSHHLK